MKRCIYLLILSVGLFGALRAHAAVSLADFGYANPIRHINGYPALGSRPLLVILAIYGNDQLTFGTNYYDGIVFTNHNYSGTIFYTNSGNTNIVVTNAGTSVVGFFNENSNGRFNWTRAGVVGLSLPNSERQTNNGGNLAGTAYYSNVVYRAMGRFAFTSYDVRAPVGTVTDDEIEIVVFSTDFSGGGLRGFGNVTRNGLTVSGALAIENASAGVPTVAHELMHGLGFFDDIYGTACTPYMTVMMWNCGENEGEIIHADAWHKMQAGWCEPRIRELGMGGVVRLPAAQLQRNDASVILYDPGRGVNEFFLLEYRAATNAAGQPWGYDRSLRSPGLVIWQVQHTATKDLDLVAPHQTGPSGQIGWAACLKCEGLFFKPSEGISRCPDTTDGTNHVSSPDLHNPLRYGGLTMVHDPSDPGQQQWRHCRKCQGLFFGPNQGVSRCPVSGLHDGSQSANYFLRFTNNPPPGSSDGWLWCKKCEGLFYGPTAADSVCPDITGGTTHDGSDSGDYSMWQYDRSVFTLSYPNLTRGGGESWPGGTMSPYLNWVDWAPTQTRIVVHPFGPMDSEITVEWWTETDTWVDFNYTGLPENGGFATPYKTMGKAVTNAPLGGIVKFKPGSKNETGIIDKRLMFEAPLGTVTIGQ